jgi:anti-anti-sigma regulatory factor
VRDAIAGTSVIIDLSGVRRMDSTGIDVFI